MFCSLLLLICRHPLLPLPSLSLCPPSPSPLPLPLPLPSPLPSLSPPSPLPLPSLPFANKRSQIGSDVLGSYTSTVFSWAAKIGSSSVPFQTSIKNYPSLPNAAFFGQFFPQGILRETGRDGRRGGETE